MSISIVLLVGLSGCSDNLNLPTQAPKLPGLELQPTNLPSTSPSLIQSYTASSYEVTDASGTIHVKYFWNSTVGQHNTLSVAVDPSYVVVGGSAVTFFGSGAGGLLTESRPDFANNAWVGSSTDHLVADSHYLWVSAIGLRLDGVSASQLKSYVSVVSVTSSPAVADPSATATLQTGFALLGGGATVNQNGGWGNFLISSMPSGQNAWVATGHDQIKSDPATITTYVIGIQNPVPNFGSITQWQSLYGPVSVNSLAVDIDNNGFIGGWVPTCPGAISTHNNGGWGRMLTGILAGPGVSFSTSGNGSTSYLFDNLQFGTDEFFMSKDHVNPDGGTLSGTVIRIQKQ